MTDDIRNEVKGDVPGNLVQAGIVESLVDNRDRRAVPLLVIVLVVVVGAAATILWLVRRTEPAEPLAAATSFAPVACESGWVVPDRGQTTETVRPADAVLSTGGQVKATLQGLSDKAVVLHSARVEVVRRQPAVPGIYLPLTCGSQVTPRFFTVDLSVASPALVPTAGEHDGAAVRPVSFPLQIGLEEIEQFEITAHSPVEDVEWVLVVHWSSGTKTGDLRVDDHGKPFRTAATTAAKEWCPLGDGSWRPSCG